MTTENPPIETPPLTGLVIPPNTVREKTQASYKFTIEELAALGTRLSHTRRDMTRVESELDSIKQDYKVKLSTIELEQDSLCRKLDDGFEMRDAAAIVTFNVPRAGRKVYCHEDTGEFIKEEAMTHADFQLPMFRNGDGQDATAPTDAELEVKDYPHVQPGEGAEFLSTDGEGTKEDLGRIVDVPNAGETPLAAALNSAAVNTEQPRIVIEDFDGAKWTVAKLMKAFRTGAKEAGWPEAAISALKAGIFKCETVPAAKELLRPHVIDTAPSFEQMRNDAMVDYPDGAKLRNHFAEILSIYPERYPGGNSEQNFNRFQQDLAEAIEAEVQESRTAEAQ